MNRKDGKNRNDFYFVMSIIFAFVLIISITLYRGNSGMVYDDPFAEIDSDLVYNIDLGDTFVHSRDMSNSISYYELGDSEEELSVIHDKTFTEITNNTIFNNRNNCNVSADIYMDRITYPAEIGVEILLNISDYELKINASDVNSSYIDNWDRMRINMTSGSAIGQIILIEGAELTNNNQNITIYLSNTDFDGITAEGMEIGDTFDIIPISTDECFLHGDTDIYFIDDPSHESMIVNKTLVGIMQLMYIIPDDLNISDILGEGDGNWGVMFFLLSGGAITDNPFSLFIEEECEIVDQDYNMTDNEYYNETYGLYNYTEIISGRNLTEEYYANTTNLMTIELEFNNKGITQLLDVYMYSNTTVTNSTTDELILSFQIIYEIEYNLIWSSIPESYIPDPSNTDINGASIWEKVILSIVLAIYIGVLTLMLYNRYKPQK